MTASRRASWRVFLRLLSLARPYWAHLVGIFALGMLAPPLALLSPIPLALVIDGVVASRPVPPVLRLLLPDSWFASSNAVLLTAAGLLLAIALLTVTHSLCVWLLQTYTGERLLVEFRARLFRHAQRLSLTYHDRKGVIDSVYRIQYDTMAIQGVVVNGAVSILTAVVTLVGLVGVIAWMEWTLAALALVICPLLYWITVRYGARIQSIWESVKNLDSHAMGVVHEVLGALRVVKAFGQEGREHGRFLKHSEGRLRRQLALARTEATMDLWVGLILGVGTAAVLVVGTLYVQSGRLSLGQLIIVMSYIAQLYEPLRTLSKRIAEVQGGLAGARRAFELLDELPEVAEKTGAIPLRRARGKIEFRNVVFGYSADRTVLKDVSFVVPPGSRLGIAGPTGSGKTTLITLLMRFHDPRSGAILLDGTDVREYRLKDLRDQFALVLQEPVLFSASIAENIAYGRPGASMDSIVEAARLANAHEFISSLPQGYETEVGERGMSLSGGERQRISLARAFLKDAPVLILDEPTSALDLHTEAKLMDAIDRLMQGRTTLFITHRLSTLEGCDLRLELAEGRVHEFRPAQPSRVRENPR